MLFQDGKWCKNGQLHWLWSQCWFNKKRWRCWRTRRVKPYYQPNCRRTLMASGRMTYTVRWIIILMSHFLCILCFLFHHFRLAALWKVILTLANLCSVRRNRLFLMVAGSHVWKIHVLTVKWAQKNCNGVPEMLYVLFQLFSWRCWSYVHPNKCCKASFIHPTGCHWASEVPTLLSKDHAWDVNSPSTNGLAQGSCTWELCPPQTVLDFQVKQLLIVVMRVSSMNCGHTNC